MKESHVESNAQSKRPGRVKNFGSIILLFVGWCLVEAPFVIHIGLWNLGVPFEEHQRSGLRYTLPCLVLGPLFIWIATRLRSRWRIALGITALVLGAGMFLQGFQIFNNVEVIEDVEYRNAFSTGLMTTGTLSALAGIALIFSQKLLDRKVLASGRLSKG